MEKNLKKNMYMYIYIESGSLYIYIYIYIYIYTHTYKLNCASQVAQLLKNPPAMQETMVLLLGWEVPLEKG